MRTDGNTIREHEMVFPRLDLAGVREWAKRVFTKERIVAFVLFGSTVAVLAVVFSALYGAMEANTIAAPSSYLSSLNWHLSLPGY